MPATHTHYVAKATETEAAMSATTTHTTTVEAVTPGADIFGSGSYRIVCTCGERVTYAGKAFTEVEAMRHARWHAQSGR